MPDELHQKVSEIVAHALRLDLAERAAYVAEASAGDRRLRLEVESLLGVDAELTEQLEMPLFELLDNEPLAAMSAGQPVGAYRIERELGRGATGAVYLASRADGAFSRQVAIKVLKRGMDTREIVRRFRNERQILASLRHSNIAELYEGGTTEDDRPYFVMERVEGEPIDRFCEIRKLHIRQRIELFLKVCSAVQFAHQNLVVHRDLKPSNILVGNDGEPKLLDFGIAKLLHPDTLQPVTATPFGLQPMTPAYASPEQVTGERITTASDIYSLGVLLFELLTGRRPYALEGPSQDELKQAICAQEPLRPSTAVRRAAAVRSSAADPPVDLRGLARRLSGDLDNIVLMALRKQPQRRYSSVEMLAQDLRRYLGGLPVRARQDTLSYRAVKFAGRHPKELTVAVLLAILVGGLLIDRELKHRQALREREKAQQVSEFLVDLFRNPGQDKGDGLRARDLLDQAVGTIESEFASQPEVRLDLLSAIGSGYARLGLFEEAAPLAEESVRRLRERYGPRHLEVARGLNDLSGIQVSLGDFGAAEETSREVLRILERRLEASHPHTTSAVHALAAVLMDQGKYEAAEPLFRQVIRNRERESGGEQNRTSNAAEGNLGLLLSFQGRYEEASLKLRSALETSRRLLGEEHPQVTSQKANLADVLRLQGYLDRAEPLILEVANVRRSQKSSHPAMADALRRWALILREKGDLEASEAALREAMAILGERFEADHPLIARTRNDLAGVLSERGQQNEAEALARQALEVWRQRLGRHPDVGDALHTLAGILMARGDMTAAKLVARESLELRQACLGRDHPAVGESLLVLARVERRAGEESEAAEWARRALAIFEQRLPAEHPRIAAAALMAGS